MDAKQTKTEKKAVKTERTRFDVRRDIRGIEHVDGLGLGHWQYDQSGRIRRWISVAN